LSHLVQVRRLEIKQAAAAPITTQGELVQAYQDTLTAFEQCRIARDTLAACINPTQPPSQ